MCLNKNTKQGTTNANSNEFGVLPKRFLYK